MKGRCIHKAEKAHINITNTDTLYIVSDMQQYFAGFEVDVNSFSTRTRFFMKTQPMFLSSQFRLHLNM